MTQRTPQVSVEIVDYRLARETGRADAKDKTKQEEAPLEYFPFVLFTSFLTVLHPVEADRCVSLSFSFLFQLPFPYSPTTMYSRPPSP